MHYRYDAIVIGAGPNGLAAAAVLAQAGYSVCVFEAKETIGGGARSMALTLPGFLHDVCSAIHPLALGSPFLRTLPLEQHGLDWIQPPIPLAHPVEDGSAVLLARSVEETAETLDCREDARVYCRVMKPLVDDWPVLSQALLGPLRPQMLTHPLALARFGLKALRSAYGLARQLFRGERARALFAGLAAHSMLPLEQMPGASFGLVLAIAGHALGWPVARGGSQQIVEALAAYIRSLGAEIVTGAAIQDLRLLPSSRVILCDVTPRQLIRMAGSMLPESYQRALERYRYGPGAFKIDYALDGSVPWKAAECLRAGTVHLGWSLEEITLSERQCWRGEPPTRPYVLLAQQSLFDATRAPAGKQTVWAYCHVPNGSSFDMTERIEEQIERFAPGFRARILARHVTPPAQLEAYNANYIGGDINGGSADLLQLFTRPLPRLVPYSTPNPRLYLCSSSTPPGGGVHGMCGYYAAHAALRYLVGAEKRSR
jgi:phytoene dehydrogenase-like protein